MYRGCWGGGGGGGSPGDLSTRLRWAKITQLLFMSLSVKKSCDSCLNALGDFLPLGLVCNTIYVNFIVKLYILIYISLLFQLFLK